MRFDRCVEEGLRLSEWGGVRAKIRLGRSWKMGASGQAPRSERLRSTAADGGVDRGEVRGFEVVMQ